MHLREIAEYFNSKASSEKGLHEILSGPALSCTFDIECGPRNGEIVHAESIYDFSGKYPNSIKLRNWPDWYSLEYFAFGPDFFT